MNASLLTRLNKFDESVMSSFEYSKSFQGSRQFSRRHKVSGLRPKIPAIPVAESVVKDPRRKRVWKACERCKIKKIKVRNKAPPQRPSIEPRQCDAEGPCKRCKEDGMICVTSSKRRSELESVPRA